MTMQKIHYAHFYLALSIFSTLMFSCTVLNLGPLKQLTTIQSTGVIIALFSLLTLVQSLRSG